MSNLPESVQIIRDAASRASAFIADRMNGFTTSYRVIVKDPKGQIRYTTGSIAAEKLQNLIVAIRLFNESTDGWKCSLLTYTYGNRINPVISSRPLPFVSKVSASRGKQALVRFFISGRSARRAAAQGSSSVRGGSKTLLRSSFITSGPHQKRPSPEEEYVTWTHSTVNNGSLLSSYEEEVRTYHREWTGVCTPGFGSLSSSELPVNPHRVFINQVDDGGYWHEFNHLTRPEWTSGTYGSYSRALGGSNTGPSPPSVQHKAEADRRAVSRMINATNSDVSNLLQDISQLRQTASTIGDVASRLAKGILLVKKKKFDLAAQTLWYGRYDPRWRKGFTPSKSGSLANNWLAFQYGWKPLLQDVDGSMRSLADFFHRTQHIIRRTVTSGNYKEFSATELTLNGPGSPSCGSATRSLNSTCRYIVDWSVDSRLTSFLSQTGFTNPINLGWEILPYSFVVDWFLPIGPYLESLSAFQGLTFHRGCKVQFSRQECHFRSSYSGISYNGDPNYSEACGGGLVDTQILFSRDNLSSWPSLGLPRLKNPLSVSHAVSALALLRQAFK